MKKIVFISNRERIVNVMESVKADLLAEGILKYRLDIIADESLNNHNLAERLINSAMVIVSWMGTRHDTFITELITFLTKYHTSYIINSTQAAENFSFSGSTSEQVEIVGKYLGYGGRNNFRNFILWMGKEFCQVPADYQLPAILPWNGIFYPDSLQPLTITEYKERFYNSGLPTIGILFSRDAWVWGDLEAHIQLIRAVEKKGMNALAVFSHWARDEAMNIPGVEDSVEEYFIEQGQPLVDTVINLIWFSLTVGRPLRDKNFLRQLNVPVIHADLLLQSPDSWGQSVAGLSPVELTANVVMPEFDGVIHGVPFAGKEKNANGTLKYSPIHERIDMLAKKAQRWAALRRKKNSDKKIAIIFHNYPPDNANIGTAIGLDSPASVQVLLEKMRQEGYETGETLEDGQQLMAELVSEVTNDRSFLSDEQIKEAIGKVSTADYLNWFKRMPKKNRKQLEKDWGPPPGSVFHYDGNIVIPGIIRGNIFISVQPPRGFSEDPNKLYHSADIAPTHHYLAFYSWIRDVFGADAIIHVGTHGSLEWLPGKGSGLSNECYPDMAIADLPNIYPYLITIVCEGIQAKRRSAACLIGHLPPPITNADTYDELSEIENLAADYYHYKLNQPSQLPTVIKLIKEKVETSNLAQDVPEREDEDFDSYLERLHGYINDIKDMDVRVGLHILGQPPLEDGLVEYLMALTRIENNAAPSLRRIVSSIIGYDYDVLLSERGKLLPNGTKTYGDIIDEVRDKAREVVGTLAKNAFSSAAVSAVLSSNWLKSTDSSLLRDLEKVCTFICTDLLKNIENTEQEITNTLNALCGLYIEPGPAGAPTSGMADVLPTGRNFYGVDPRALPTRSAWELGKQLGDAMLERFIEDEGHYPESVGIVLWSGANMRSRGQCIAEFLYLMGVCPVWQRGSGRVTSLDVIPLHELGRPRIDVTARISGMFRDAMPPAVDLLDEAVNLIANLDEPLDMNYVRKHVLVEQKSLTEQGVDYEQAMEQACYRIFGCQPGTYGAGVGALLENKNWQTVDDIGKVYVTWGGYAYTRQVKGKFTPESFSRRLAVCEATVKNEDNREVNMLDSDDFNAFHGGMIAAVRSLRGKAPRSYCGDTSDPQQAVVRELREETKRLFRGQVMNPKFLEGMKKHGYKGAADLASIVAHCYEWDATSKVMDDWMYDDLAQKYVLDDEMRRWMQQVNPAALRRITEKLLEAEQRSLWQADKHIKQDLIKVYLEVEGELEDDG